MHVTYYVVLLKTFYTLCKAASIDPRMRLEKNKKIHLF